MVLQILLDRVIVEQSVVDIDQENDRMKLDHAAVPLPPSEQAWSTPERLRMAFKVMPT
jgi:hypothetical protein